MAREGPDISAKKESKKSRRTSVQAIASTRKLGTFLGVFTPTLLTILGVIMYLRFGWVVGQVGLIRALAIVLLANAITLCTTLSFSAIATNTRVGVGGAYFIISRSMGLEVGGAIGIPLFLSQVFSVTLYAFGLAETIQLLWTDMPPRAVEAAAFVIILGVGALSLRGANIALRSQIPVMALVGISILVLAIGVIMGARATAPADVVAAPTESFWFVFAVFFPAVTGVMAGLGLSGDLEDPRRSIPRGSLAAGIAGFLVYLVIIVLLFVGADQATLLTKKLVWTELAPLGAWLIFPGMWGAIFSSAVGSMLGAPRTLQALAQDHADKSRILRRMAGEPGKEPILGLVLSLLIALTAVFLGGLNAVAEVVTMFFLTVYGTVNIVAALERLSGDATWRPRINVPWPVSLLGGLGCFAGMFLINWVAGLIAVAVEIGLWLFFQRLEMRSDWGDMRRDIYEALIRWALIKLARRPMTARNWRPHVMVFTRQLESRLDLLRYGIWFSQNRGVVTVCELKIGDLLDTDLDGKPRQSEMTDLLRQEGVIAFPEVHVVGSVERGIADVVQANGMAGMRSNTILMGWADDPDRLAESLKLLPGLERLNRSVVICRSEASRLPRQGKRRNIHIWWGGLERNGDLMLLLAHLMTRNPEWRGARITILSIASNELTRADTQKKLDHLLPEARIDAATKVMIKDKEQTMRELIHGESVTADAVFLGLATPTRGEELAYAQRMGELAEGLPTVFFVKNASLFVGELL